LQGGHFSEIQEEYHLEACPSALEDLREIPDMD
jgi:hypothetical protein